MYRFFKNSIIVQMQGGIGNQLFILAFAKALSLQKNKKLYIDYKLGFEKDDYNRKYLLEPLNIFESKIELNFLESVFYKIIIRIIRWNQKIISFQNYFNDNKIPSFYFLNGYFQSENFFKKYRSEIQKMFSFKKPKFSLKQEFNKFSKKNLVAIHVRDFSIDQKRLGKKEIQNVNFNYYFKCIKYFSSKIINPQFIVFSEKSNNFTKISKFFPKLNFINYKNPNNFSDLEILYLMSSFENIIIANSTYSWWAAWLNNKKFKKNILCPSINKKNINWNDKSLLPKYFKQIN